MGKLVEVTLLCGKTTAEGEKIRRRAGGLVEKAHVASALLSDVEI